jgi:hypothetical protein
MSVDFYESSQQLGDPIQLFRFTYGTEPGEYFAYTDHTQAVTADHGGSIGEVTYEPVPIDHEAIVADGTLDRSAIKINFDIDTGIAELFRVYPPSNVVTLVIYHGHLDDPDGAFSAVWSGRVLGAAREGSELTLQGVPVSSQMLRPGLRRHYQYGCPHALYGPQCRADKAAATVAATVASLTATTVTLTAGWEGAFDPGKFVRGMLEWTPAGQSTQRRTIIRRSGDTLTLSGITKALDVADAVAVVLGCNHHAFADKDGDCEGLHVPVDGLTPTNLPNFGGDPWIPLKNIINKNPYY